MSKYPPAAFLSKDNKDIEGVTRTYESASHTVTYAVSSHPGMESVGREIVTKENQDSWALAENWHGPNYLYFGVCDGHGEKGAEVSQYVTSILSRTLSSGVIFHQDLTKSALKRLFDDCSTELRKSKIDCRLSGTTAVFALLHNNHMTCAWLGDSRCLLGQIGRDGALTVQEVTRDHKPSIYEERERILSCGGKIEPLKASDGSFQGPERIWVASGEAPGLTMTRALGDELAASVGVLSDPEILSFDLGPEHKYLVLCSDGLSEFMENEEILRRVHAGAKAGKAPNIVADELVEEARGRWRTREGSVDDITCFVVYLDFKSDFKGGVSRVPRASNLNRTSIANGDLAAGFKYNAAALAALAGRPSFSNQRKSLDAGSPVRMSGLSLYSASESAPSTVPKTRAPLPPLEYKSSPSSSGKRSSDIATANIERSATSATGSHVSASKGQGSIDAVSPGLRKLFFSHQRSPSYDIASGATVGEYTAMRLAQQQGGSGRGSGRSPQVSMSDQPINPKPVLRAIGHKSSSSVPALPQAQQVVKSNSTSGSGQDRGEGSGNG